MAILMVRQCSYVSVLRFCQVAPRTVAPFEIQLSRSLRSRPIRPLRMSKWHLSNILPCVLFLRGLLPIAQPTRDFLSTSPPSTPIKTLLKTTWLAMERPTSVIFLAGQIVQDYFVLDGPFPHTHFSSGSSDLIRPLGLELNWPRPFWTFWAPTFWPIYLLWDGFYSVSTLLGNFWSPLNRRFIYSWIDLNSTFYLLGHFHCRPSLGILSRILYANFQVHPGQPAIALYLVTLNSDQDGYEKKVVPAALFCTVELFHSLNRLGTLSFCHAYLLQLTQHQVYFQLHPRLCNTGRFSTRTFQGHNFSTHIYYATYEAKIESLVCGPFGPY